MKKNRKIYPIRLDPKTYKTFQIIADAKGLNTAQCIRQALGLFIADNLMMLQIKEAGWEHTTQPATHKKPITDKDNNND